MEQYTISLNFYAATQDLNMVTSRVGIAAQFLQNAATNGEQAARSLDELARNALFAPYFGGNTRVPTTLASAGPSIEVDDIRGFQTVFVNGVQQAVSASAIRLRVTVGTNFYTLVGVTPDATNVSTAPNGISGAADLLGQCDRGAMARRAMPCRRRPRALSCGRRAAPPPPRLQATDTLTMSNLLDAVALLRRNAVPTVDGVYNCYLDPVSARQLFADPDFKQLFQGATQPIRCSSRGW